MKQETKRMLNEFDIYCDEEIQFSDRYKFFEDHIKQNVMDVSKVNVCLNKMISGIKSSNPDITKYPFVSSVIICKYMNVKDMRI